MYYELWALGILQGIPGGYSYWWSQRKQKISSTDLIHIFSQNITLLQNIPIKTIQKSVLKRKQTDFSNFIQLSLLKIRCSENNKMSQVGEMFQNQTQYNLLL